MRGALAAARGDMDMAEQIAAENKIMGNDHDDQDPDCISRKCKKNLTPEETKESESIRSAASANARTHRRVAGYTEQ